jgi:hypothetical protein
VNSNGFGIKKLDCFRNQIVSQNILKLHLSGIANRQPDVFSFFDNQAQILKDGLEIEWSQKHRF